MAILKLNKFLIIVFLAIFLLNFHLSGADSFKFIYHFVEAENTVRKLPESDIRRTGFTWFMGTPSGGKVVVLGAPWHYKVNGLPAGKYNVWIRQLNWRSAKEKGKTANTQAAIRGQKIGDTYYPPQICVCAFWALRWSKVGQAKLDGKPFILDIKPSDDNIQVPYMDAILLTNDLSYTPEFANQDFKSFNRIDKHIKLTGVKLDGLGKDAGLRVNISSPDSFAKCRVEARFSNEKKRSLHVFDSVCSIKKGTDTLTIPVKGLTKGSYPVRIRIIAPGTQTVIASADFKVEVGELWKAVLENNYLLHNENLCRVKVSVTDSNLAAKAEKVRLAVFSGGKELSTRNYSLKPSSTELAYDAKTLTAGKYELRVSLLDKSARVLEETKFPLIKTRKKGDFPKLEPVKKVEIVNDQIMVNGKNFIPRKLFHANAEKKFKQQGYNTVDCWGVPKSMKWRLDKAAANNMYGYAVLFDPYFYDRKTKKFKLGRIKEFVGKFKDHPALFCWLLFDEPEGVGVNPNDMMAAADVIRAADPNHPVMIDYYQPMVLPQYAGCSDLSGFNAYPVPNTPISTIAEGLDTLKKSLKDKKHRAMEISMQTYGNPTTRMPTPAEYKAMLYLAINHGARSFADYSWNEGADHKLCLQHDVLLWSYVKIINREILALEKVISAGKPLPGAAKCTNRQIDWSLREADGKVYLIAVNTLAKKAEAEFTVPLKYHGAGVVFENRKMTVKNGQMTDGFAPFEVHVYQLDAK